METCDVALRPEALRSLLSFMYLYFCYLQILVKCNDKNYLCLQNNPNNCVQAYVTFYTQENVLQDLIMLSRCADMWNVDSCHLKKNVEKIVLHLYFKFFCSLFLWLLHKWAKWSNLLSLRGRVESAARQASVNGWQDRVSQTSLARKTDSYLSFQQNYVLNFFLHPPVNEFWFLH